MARLGAATTSLELPIANGGTAATSTSAALTNLLPSQSGNTGKILSTNGSTHSWFGATISAGANTQVAFVDSTTLSGDADFTYVSGTSLLTITNMTVTTSLDLAGSNVTYVPLSGDINTYITNAAAGDTLMLGAGTYTITSSINVSKALTIIGQGKCTLVTTSTASVTMFNVTSDNVNIKNMRITCTAGSGSGNIGIKVDATGGTMFSNVNIMMVDITLSGGECYGIEANDASVNVNDVFISLSQASGTTSLIGFRQTMGATGEAASTSNLTMVRIFCSGNSSAACYGVQLASYNSYAMTVNIFDSVITANNAGAGDGYGIYTQTNTDYVNFRHSSAGGKTYDVNNSGGGTFTISNALLDSDVNNGTISFPTSSSYIVTNGLTFNDGGNIILNTTTGNYICGDTSQRIGFWGTAPTLRQTGWTTSGYSSDKTIDASNTSINEVANVLCTLIEQLKTYGLFGA